MGRRLTVVMPVFNDWTSAQHLVRDIAAELDGRDLAIDVIAVDDFSSEAVPDQLDAPAPIGSVECVALGANLGHQRAIAVGLMVAAERADLDLVAVMDSDGEDRPAELARMVDLAIARPGEAVVAQRAQRSEGWLFRLSYWFYVRLFRLLTGQRIQFGNFSVLGAREVRRVITCQHLWNNFAAALIQSRIAIAWLPTRRGTRYAGQSKMNFVSLVAHGLGAISVFGEAVFIRIVIASLVLLAGVVCAVGATLYFKYFTALAVPSWATTVLGFAAVIGIQALMMPILMAFMLLSGRAQVQPPPRVTAPGLIAARRRLAPPD